MIVLRTGLPGAGKTYSVLRDIYNDLVLTDRYIITNIEELKMPELWSLLEKREGVSAPDLDGRLRVIPKEMTPEFFRYRSGGLVLPKLETAYTLEAKEQFLLRFKEYFLPVADPAHPEWSKPVSYYISEAHDYFEAKDWQNVGRGVQLYASKHRHLSDEVVFETQHPDMLCNQFRKLVAYTEECTNEYKSTFGVFKSKGGFRQYVYYRVPDLSSGKKQAVEVRSYQMDKELASCYDTTGALGIRGRGPEKERARARKMPYWSFWAILASASIIAAAALWKAPEWAGQAVGHLVGGVTGGFGRAVHAQPAVVSGAVSPVSKDVARPSDSAGAARSSSLSVRGYVLRGSKVQVVLTDGRILTEEDPSLTVVNRQSVVVDGERLYMRLPSDSGLRQPVATALGAAAVEKSVVRPADVPAEQRSVSTSDDAGSWTVGADGVSRLKDKVTLAR